MAGIEGPRRRRVLPNQYAGRILAEVISARPLRLVDPLPLGVGAGLDLLRHLATAASITVVVPTP